MASWGLINLFIMIELVASTTFFTVAAWFVIIIIYTMLLFAALLYFTSNKVHFNKHHDKILEIHLNFVLSQNLVFIPILFGAGVSATVSYSRFNEYLTIYFIMSFPCVAIFLMYMLDQYTDESKKDPFVTR